MSAEESYAPVGIDTDILIQFYRNESDFAAYKDPKQRDEQRLFALYAARLLDRLKAENRTILVSSVTVGEFLVREPLSKHGALIRALQELFTIVNFSLRSASLAAQIASAAPSRSKATRRNNDRMIVSADTKIIASLVAGGAKTIYFHDKHAREIAAPFVKSLDLPCEPINLLDVIEDRDAAPHVKSISRELG